MKLLILALCVVCAMGAPIVLTPSGLAFQSTSSGIPTLLSTGQIIQQPTIFTQAVETQSSSINDQFSLRDPVNPSTDVVLHSGFPFVSASLAPAAIQAQPLTTRVGISTLGSGAQSAHFATVQPVTTPAPVIQPQLHSTFTSLPLTSIQSPSSVGQSTAFLIPAPQSQVQPATEIRSIPITLAGPFQLTTN